jgi:uncharacterized membrane protein
VYYLATRFFLFLWSVHKFFLFFFVFVSVHKFFLFLFFVECTQVFFVFVECTQLHTQCKFMYIIRRVRRRSMRGHICMI